MNFPTALTSGRSSDGLRPWRAPSAAARRAGLLACALSALLVATPALRASDPPFPPAMPGLVPLARTALTLHGHELHIDARGLLAQVAGGALLPTPLEARSNFAPGSLHAALGANGAEWAVLTARLGDAPLLATWGSRPGDWAGRGGRLPDLLECVRDPTALVSVSRIGDLHLRTEWHVLPGHGRVVMTLVVRNRHAEPLHDLVVAREWQRADGSLLRAEWALGTLAPRQSASVVVHYLPAGGGGQMAASALDVPVTLWVAPDHPFGLPIGATNGISWGDFDRDGWPDIFSAESGLLWRNLGGSNWSLAANLKAQLPPATIRYGASFGDFDNDGYPDLAIEPRKVLTGDTCFHLMRNLGGSGAFEDVADQPLLDGPLCLFDSETFCWGDVDGDGLLDLVLPAYPPEVLNGTGNLFLHNLGPTGPGGAWRMAQKSIETGLFNPPGHARPEGAQLADIDGDGDLDLFSNGALYRNTSTRGVPSFVALPEISSGIGHVAEMDEGAAFLDYDMDGDLDLFVAYFNNQVGLKIYESRGDGTFFEAEAGIVDGPFLGAGLGLSVADWDLDGDLDVSTRFVFRRNQMIETGTRKFTLGLSPIPPTYLTSATPAWGDWDRDGDLDLALGNYLSTGSFWTSTVQSPGMPAAQRRDLRVLVLRDSDEVAMGLQTEFGASVELVVHGDEPGRRRVQFVASSHGYLNQNEYALTFGLPPGPDPEQPALGVSAELVVTFPGTEAEPLRRIDRRVNPALGAIVPAELADREIVVFRSGRVVRDGVTHPPDPREPPDLRLAPYRLVQADPGLALAPPVPAPTANRWVGAELDTTASSVPVRVVELQLDGQLDQSVSCTVPFNIALWDVTDPLAPELQPEHALVAQTSPRNHRTHLPVDLLLQPGRRYRLVAAVTSSRVTFGEPASPGDELVVNGGFNFRDEAACLGSTVASVKLLPARSFLALRWRPVTATTWNDLGGALAGSAGLPLLSVAGDLVAGEVLHFALSSAAPHAPVWLVAGLSVVNLPFKGGTLVPHALIAFGGLGTDSAGTLALEALVAAGLPDEIPLVLQAWIADAGAVQGAAASNGVAGFAP